MAPEDLRRDANTAAGKSIRQRTIVNIFDWGRSELNTNARHARLSATEQKSRIEFWNYYVQAAATLASEALSFYRARFGEIRWRSLTFKVMDFNQGLLSTDNFLGMARIELNLTSGSRQNVTLTTKSGAGARSTLTYSIAYKALPHSDRLAGFWQIRLFSAENLKAADLSGYSDPY